MSKGQKEKNCLFRSFLKNLTLSITNQFKLDVVLGNLDSSPTHRLSKILDFENSEFIKLQLLGKGGFGEVEKAYHKGKGIFMALKFNPNNNATSILEDKILQKIENLTNQQNMSSLFLKYYGHLKFFSISGQMMIKLQIEIGLCTLHDVLKGGMKYTPKGLFFVLKGLVREFAWLQKNGIAHRDVKEKNIILVEDGRNDFSYVISDFGIGCDEFPLKCDEISYQTIKGLTRGYAAPEIEIKNKDCVSNYNPYKSDVFSLGIVILKMINCVLEDQSITKILLNIEKNRNEEAYRTLSKFLTNNKEAFNEYKLILPLLKKMLDYDVTKRLDFLNLENELNFANEIERPTNERYYYLESRKIKESKEPKKLHKFYFEHYKLFEEYLKISRINNATLELERAREILDEIEKNLLVEEEINKQEDVDKIHDQIDFHVQKIRCSNGFANIHIKNDDLDKADKKLNDSLDIWKNFEKTRTEQQKSNKTTTIGKNLQLWSIISGEIYDLFGHLEKSKGHLQKAEDFYLKSFKMRQEVVGENHFQTANSYKLLGILYYHMGNFQKAEEFLLIFLKIRTNLFIENHCDIACCYINLGVVYKNLGDLKKAKKFYLKSLNIRLNLFGESHSNTAGSYNNLGVLFKNIGNYQKAEEFYLKSLKINEQLFSEKHSNSATCFHNLGVLYHNMKSFKKAKDCDFKSLNISRALFGKNYCDTAGSYNNLGTHSEMSDPKKAQKFYLKFWEICQVLGPSNSAASYNNLGILDRDREDLQKTEEYFLKSTEIHEELFGKHSDPNLKLLKIRQMVFGENHIKTAKAYQTLSILNKNIERIDLAQEYASKAETIIWTLYGPSHLRGKILEFL